MVYSEVKPDHRKWRIVSKALPCKYCGAQPIVASSGRGVGWNIQCPNDAKHGYHFEQWLKKCIRKWNMLHGGDC